MYIFIFSIIFYIIGAATVRYNLFPYPWVLSLKNSIPIDKKAKFTENKYVSLHKIYATKQADIVMLGDSLTSNVNWSELFDKRIINRGVGGDITEGYLQRLEYVYDLRPKKVFVNGGTNDFQAGYSVEDVFENYKKIIKILQTHDIEVIMQSTVYTSFEPINQKNKQLNQMLEKYCTQNNIIFIDLNEGLSKNFKLLDKYSLDGAHINAAGYAAWRDIIKPYL